MSKESKLYCVITLVILTMMTAIACDDIFEEDISDDEVFLLAPAEGAVIEEDTLITLSWDFLEGASAYQVQLVSPSFENAGQLLIDSITTNNTVRVAITPGEYEWAVRGLNNGFTTLFFQNRFRVNADFVSDFSQQIVSTLAPRGELTTSDVLFAWDDLAGAVRYQLQVASPSFTNPTLLLYDTTVIETNATLEVPNGEYQWRVRAIDEADSRTLYTTLDFSVVGNIDFVELEVNQIAPIGMVAGQDVLFIWDELNEAETYQVQIVTPSFANPSSLLYDTTVSVSNLTLDVPIGSHQWRIRATNSSEERTGFTITDFNVE